MGDLEKLKISPIKKKELKREVYEKLKRLILSGKLSPGTRLVERDLAQVVNVSRTPLREAFSQLENDGLIQKLPVRGFIVALLSEKEIEQIYPVIASLERLAVNEIQGLTMDMIKGFKRANKKLEGSKGNPEVSIAADKAWHDALLSTFENSRAKDILSNLKTSSERYERAFFNKLDNSKKSIDEHLKIEKLLLENRTEEAAIQIENHWLDCMKPMKKIISKALPEN